METEPTGLDALQELQAIAAGEEIARSEEVQQLLRQVLVEEWDQATQQATRVALDELEAQEGAVDVAQVLERLQPTLQRRYAQRVGQAVAQSITASYTTGQEAVDIEVAQNITVTDRRARRALEEDMMYWIRTHYDRQVRGRLQEKAKEVIGEGDGLGRRRAGEIFREEFQPEFGESQTYWELMSNHVTTRSREFGRVEAYVKAGVEAYQIDAVLDRRTSEICRHLDGMTFPVSAAVQTRDRLLDADDPEVVKEAAPWLDADTIKGLTADELAERGVVFPPFHPHCRSRTFKAP